MMIAVEEFVLVMVVVMIMVVVMSSIESSKSWASLQVITRNA